MTAFIRYAEPTAMTRLIAVTLLSLAFSPVSLQAHDVPSPPEPMRLDELLGAFGWDMDEVDVRREKVADNLYVLFGVGGNVAASIGDDGVLIVDDQFPAMIPKLRDSIAEAGGEEVDFAINTHWHFDHADGNQTLGPDGTWLVSHANSREMMQGSHLINLVGASYQQEPYPDEALPVITYDDSMQFHFNGERVELLHFGPAHTTGDTAVVFRGANAVHLGDVFNNAGYPFIDAGNGGTLDGVIRFCKATLDRIDEGTTVIPGHGPVADYKRLQDYVEMLESVRQRMMTLIEEGATLQDVYDAKVTAAYDEEYGDPTGFINRSYLSLTHRPAVVR